MFKAEADLFDELPTAVWEEDYRELKLEFARLRAQGVLDLQAYLLNRPDRLAALWSKVRILRANRRACSMMGARSFEELVEHVDSADPDKPSYFGAECLLALWSLPDGAQEVHVSSTLYTLAGQTVHARCHARCLTGHEHDWGRMLWVLEDITDLVEAQEQLVRAQRHAFDLFEQSPVALWVEDFSGIRQILQGLRQQQVHDLGAYLVDHPGVLERCIHALQVVRANRVALEQYGVSDIEGLQQVAQRILLSDQERFAQELAWLWQGRLAYSVDAVKEVEPGSLLHLHIQVAVMAGHEETWDRVLVSLVDQTESKRSEAALRHLSRHDALTGLPNRLAFIEALQQRDGQPTVSLAAVDMNGLKQLNDRLGHAAGDRGLKTLASLLQATLSSDMMAARLGGDEFAVLMPSVDAVAAAHWQERLALAVESYNLGLGEGEEPISVSVGVASRQPGEPLMATLDRADARMYVKKRNHYASGLQSANRVVSRET
jgi:diguanylate cyclase (GGDEF)-like protein